MDYEKAYKEALERAQALYNDKNEIGYANAESVLEEVFPLLKESDDERVRKEIIQSIKDNMVVIHKDECIAWLEKQAEQKPTLRERYKNIAESEWFKKTHDGMSVSDDEKVDNVNKVEPKFKVGDFIVNDYCMGKVIALTDDAYLLDTEQGIPFSYEHNAHLWTIQDAKDGDVLVDRFSKDNIIILYKGINPKLSVLAYCGWNGYNLSIKTNGLGYGNLDNTNYYPATKEQRGLLFKKMKEAGYEWDSEKKELKKIEQKEEDIHNKLTALEFSLKHIMEEAIECGDTHNLKADADMLLRLTQKPWSEKDKKEYKYVLKFVDNVLNNCGNKKDYEHCKRCYDWLKSLKQRIGE